MQRYAFRVAQRPDQFACDLVRCLLRRLKVQLCLLTTILCDPAKDSSRHCQETHDSRCRGEHYHATALSNGLTAAHFVQPHAEQRGNDLQGGEIPSVSNFTCICRDRLFAFCR